MPRLAVTATAFMAIAVALSAAPGAAQDAQPDDPIAVVNGEAITVGDLNDFYDTVTANAPQQPPLDQRAYDGLRDYLIGRKLVIDAAEGAGLADDPDVAAALAQTRDDLLAQFFMTRRIAEEVTEEAVVAEYGRRIADMPTVEEVRASHILVETLEQAEALRAEIEGGAAFADVAAEHGTDGTRTQGGDLGWFTADRMVAPFAEAAFALPVDTLSTPVETQFGWHLILVTDRREQAPPTLEAMRPQILEDLNRQAADALIEGLRADAEVVLTESRPGLPAPAAE